VFFDGAIYHVFNRVARGDRILGQEDEAARFVGLLKEVFERDQVTVLAWSVLPNHYHLALRTGPVSLDRPMRSVHQRFSRQFNGKHRIFGPLWQGRYKAKLVADQRYLDQLVVYIHMNPVVAKLVSDPADYRWSGHREIVKRLRRTLIDKDEVLRIFGKTRRIARARYVNCLEGAVDQPWVGEAPGSLPWWRLGRPPKGDAEDPESSGENVRREALERHGLERPDLDEEDFVRLGASFLGIELDELRGRNRSGAVVEVRELLAALGVERYGLVVKRLAAVLRKHPVTASGWVMRGVQKRHADRAFNERYEALDQFLVRGERED